MRTDTETVVSGGAAVESCPGVPEGGPVATGSPRTASAKKAIAVVAESDAYLHQTLEAMIEWYDWKWGAEQDDWAVLHCESEWQTKMIAPDGKPTRFKLAGKIDKLAMRAEWLGLMVVDHKTTAYDLSPESPYWKQLSTDLQGVHYQLLGLACIEDPISDVVWDSIQKPTIRPQKHRETAEQWGQRVREWYAGRGPERTIARQSVAVPHDDVVQYHRDLYMESREILHSRRTKFWRKNPGACLAYGRPCAFLGICSGFDTPDSEHWVRDKSHAELSSKLKGDLLTHSRMSCLRQCERKHYYKYELGLKRDREQEEEALYFGSLWHEAMDAYWTYKED